MHAVAMRSLPSCLLLLSACLGACTSSTPAAEAAEPSPAAPSQRTRQPSAQASPGATRDAAHGAPRLPFGTGVVVLGMCPDEAIAAAGSPGPYVVRRDPAKWPAGTFPPTIVAAQCEHPDDSVIELLFRNSSQFGTDEPVVFRVKFERGRAVSIDRVRAR